MSFSLNDVDELKHLQFRGIPSVGGVISNVMNQNFNDVHFQPDFVVLNGVNLSSSTAVLSPTGAQYPLHWNLTNNHFATAALSSTNVTNSVFKIQKPVDQLTVTISQLFNDGTMKAPTTMNNDWSLTLDMTLVKMKKYDPHSSRVG